MNYKKIKSIKDLISIIGAKL